MFLPLKEQSEIDIEPGPSDFMIFTIKCHFSSLISVTIVVKLDQEKKLLVKPSIFNVRENILEKKSGGTLKNVRSYSVRK